MAGSPWGEKIAEVGIPAAGDSEWLTLRESSRYPGGIHALWLVFTSESEEAGFSLDWVEFQ
jgi:hypothetical protein